MGSVCSNVNEVALQTAEEEAPEAKKYSITIQAEELLSPQEKKPMKMLLHGKIIAISQISIFIFDP